MTYSVFINGLSKSGITVDRKVLSDLAIQSPRRSRRSLKRPRPPWRRKFEIACVLQLGVMPREGGASSNHRPIF